MPSSVIRSGGCNAAALIAWLLPGMTPVQRMWAANLFLGFLLDVLVVGTIKGIVGRG